jgi:hypothetical protein
LAKKQEKFLLENLSYPIAIRAIADYLELDTDMIGLITVDGKLSKWTDEVVTDSRICFFPHLTGG